jgi:Tfp pilus assembly protein PilZ
MNSREYYMIKKELVIFQRKMDEIKVLLVKVIERQEKIELSGEVTYGEPHHIGRKEKQVNISLRPPTQPYKNL